MLLIPRPLRIGSRWADALPPDQVSPILSPPFTFEPAGHHDPQPGASEVAHERDRCAMIKRTFDLAVALIGLLVILPLLAAIAIAVRLDSPGPILFRPEAGGAERSGLRALQVPNDVRPRGDRERLVRGPGNGSRVTRLGAASSARRRWMSCLSSGTSSRGRCRWSAPGRRSEAGWRPPPSGGRSPTRSGPASRTPPRSSTGMRSRSWPPRPTRSGLYRPEILPGKLDQYEAYVRSRSFRGDPRDPLEYGPASFAT